MKGKRRQATNFKILIILALGIALLITTIVLMIGENKSKDAKLLDCYRVKLKV